MLVNTLFVVKIPPTYLTTTITATTTTSIDGFYNDDDSSDTEFYYGISSTEANHIDPYSSEDCFCS
jgi:hypothetical protein